MTMSNEDDGELARKLVFAAEDEGEIGVRCLDVVGERHRGGGRGVIARWGNVVGNSDSGREKE